MEPRQVTVVEIREREKSWERKRLTGECRSVSSKEDLQHPEDKTSPDQRKRRTD